MNAERSTEGAEYHPESPQPGQSPRRRRGPLKLWAERRLPGIARGLINLLWRTCRVQIEGRDRIKPLLDSGHPFIPCYWHGHQIFCVRALLDLREEQHDLKLGYLISPSRDGEAAAKVFADLDLHIVRGSATRGGAQALREIYQIIRRDGVSPIVTPDGPTGPHQEFKPGVVMLASLASLPILPLSFAAYPVLRLTSWDRMIVPLPFARVRVVIGDPVEVPRGLDTPTQTALSQQLSRKLVDLGAIAEQWAPFNALPIAQQPVVLGVVAEPSGVNISLSLPATLPWFDGHFPNNPVLPAVASVHLAGVAARALLIPGREISSSGRLKFQQPILPDTPLSLHLGLSAGKAGGTSVRFRFESAAGVCASGTLGFADGASTAAV